MLAVVVVNPRGDFPLNDDWAFADTARRLFENHDWQPSFWGNMSLVTQTVWGALFCAFDGCSYRTLRFSSLAADALILVTMYKGLRSSGSTLGQAVVGAVTVAFNPVLFELAFTFMTDAFFTLVLLVSALAFAGHLRTGSRPMLIVAATLAVVAILCRQLGLCLPLAFAAVSLLRKRSRMRDLVGCLLPLTFGLCTLLAYEAWMSRTGRTPSLYYTKNIQLLHILADPVLLAHNLFFNAVTVSMYMGLFAAPLTLTMRLKPLDDRTSPALRRLPMIGASVLTAAALATCVASLGAMPIRGNILVPQGLGPLTLRDTHLLHLANVVPLPATFWLCVTAVALLGVFRSTAIVLRFLVRAWSSWRSSGLETRDEVALFSLLAIAAYYVPLLPANVFERYTATIVPLLLLACVLAEGKQAESEAPSPYLVRSLASAGLTASVVAFAVLGTHDYLSWNRARWRAIADLTRLEPAVDASTLDGGFEYNGAAFEARPHDVSPDKSWWWVKDDRYLISFGPVDGYDQVLAVAYRTHLPPARRFIYALRRR